ncbi:protein prenylyltransferase [Piromyces finnis]|uniref:Geranylgeranyl transferase type-2 subunit alpha n=1 Tax=Piromyces finnis TaxID=1754191 RepID=A0A1Y1V9D1_9FUNG|nr:protein prenylyltransferase [Piromyces finnis]|eukprot:ORX50397.1 protein prenylyltransferase [Piromyces finnis]
MHGVKKAYISEEIRQEKKLKEKSEINDYLNLVKIINEKRKNKVYDSEAFNITTKILSMNVEYYTLWNFRRKILLHEFETLTSEEKEKKFETELEFQEKCVRKKPKSYWAWNHRRWILENMEKPNWKRELLLVNGMLNLDTRNFHGWDYRRYVISKSEVSTTKEEFEYTKKKISQSFSNYSAWHYRSKLIPKLITKKTKWEKLLGNELEMVKNAEYTDPADQSAWLYHCWLLGDDNSLVGIKNCYIIDNIDNTYTLGIEFFKKIKLVSSNSIKISLNNENQNSEFFTPSIRKNKFSKLWISKLTFKDFSKNQDSIIKISFNKNEVITIDDKKLIIPDLEFALNSLYIKDENMNYNIKEQLNNFNSLCKEEKKEDQIKIVNIQPSEDILNEELESVRELLELEPDSKWALLTLVKILSKLGNNEDEIIEILEKLKDIDIFRKEYYMDFVNQFKMNKCIMKADKDISLDLSSQDLTKLPLIDECSTFKKIDLSNNPSIFKSIDNENSQTYDTLSYLISVNTLIINKNSLKSIPRSLLSLLNITELYLENNEFSNLEDLKLLKQIKSLKTVHLGKNPLLSSHEESEIKEYFNGIDIYF